jgi:lipopolysaccharide export LptBFGC system permease protein LptF
MKKSKLYRDKWGNIRYRDSDKTVAVARVEKAFGHKLSKGSVVHHKNRDKSDNKLSNLWVFKSQEEHDRIHRKDKRRFGRW